MTAAPEGPYLIRDPLPDVTGAPLVVFLGGGSGRRSSAMRIWTNYLANAHGIDAFRVVLPYTVKEDEYFSEADRTYRIVDELARCYGRPSMVHLAGVSNGGVAAFGLAVTKPDRFDTVMGAPGVLVPMDAGELGQALRGRAVFNGVGALDEGWKPQVRAMHEALRAVGIRSIYSEFPSQGHTAGADFDGTLLVDFWNSATAAPRTPRRRRPPRGHDRDARLLPEPHERTPGQHRTVRAALPWGVRCRTADSAGVRRMEGLRSNSNPSPSSERTV